MKVRFCTGLRLTNRVNSERVRGVNSIKSLYKLLGGGWLMITQTKESELLVYYLIYFSIVNSTFNL